VTFIVPNGIAFTPDERLLYVNDSRRRHIRAFELLPNACWRSKTDSVFADLAGKRARRARWHEGRPGRQCLLWRSGGLYILNAQGKKLGRIVHAMRDHQHCVRRRRLENALLHQPQQPVLGQSEGCGRAGSGRGEEGVAAERRRVCRRVDATK